MNSVKLPPGFSNNRHVSGKLVASKMSDPKQSIKINDRFTSISSNFIYYIICNLCKKKIYFEGTGRQLAYHFREQLRNVKKNVKGASKPVSRHFNLTNHSTHNITIYGLSQHQGKTESGKNVGNECFN